MARSNHLYGRPKCTAALAVMIVLFKVGTGAICDFVYFSLNFRSIVQLFNKSLSSIWPQYRDSRQNSKYPVWFKRSWIFDKHARVVYPFTSMSDKYPYTVQYMYKSAKFLWCHSEILKSVVCPCSLHSHRD